MAPQLATHFVQETLHRAIDGVGPLPPASVAADRQLTEQHGDRKKAVREVIENHVAYAGAQGFVTNIGGIASAAFAIPANMAGLALVQTRMVAGIAHLRGYDLDDPRVRNAILACLIGPDGIASLVKKKRLPAPPMTIATAPTHDPMLDQLVAAEVVAELLTRIAGKRVVTTVGRRVPVLGGLVGAGSDGVSTWQIGRYAAKELLPRRTA
jgi:uncharacterized protein (DUF697 family)